MKIKELQFGEEYAISRSGRSYDLHNAARARLKARRSRYEDRYGSLQEGTGFEFELLDDEPPGYARRTKGETRTIPAKQVISTWVDYLAARESEKNAAEALKQAHEMARQRGIKVITRLEEMGYGQQENGQLSARYSPHAVSNTVILSVEVAEKILTMLPPAPEEESVFDTSLLEVLLPEEGLDEALAPVDETSDMNDFFSS